MSEWKELSLSDCCDLIAGYAFKSKDFGDYPVKVLKIADINPPFVSSDSSVGVNIDNYDLRKIEKFLVKKGDYLLAMTGATIGKLGRYISEDDAYLNQRVLKFQAKENIDNDFLYYVLSGYLFNKYVINHIDSESAQPNISAGTIGKYTFIAPSLLEQNNISSILSSLDDKIAVNKKICENLEAQAQALFKHWFVDFSPFKYGKFVESELGLIPEGWRVSSLSSIAEYRNGLAMQKFRPEDGEEGLPVLKIKELGQGGFDANSELCSPSKIGNKYTINDGDIIFSWSGTLMVKTWCGGKCGLNQHLFDVVPNDYPKWFVYLWTKHHLDNFIRIAKDKAVTMGHIKRAELDKAKVAVPSDEDLNKINALMAPIHQQIVNCEIESRRLAELRDTLLPKLMSGQIKINEVEKSL